MEVGWFGEEQQGAATQREIDKLLRSAAQERPTTGPDTATEFAGYGLEDDDRSDDDRSDDWTVNEGGTIEDLFADDKDDTKHPTEERQENQRGDEEEKPKTREQNEQASSKADHEGRRDVAVAMAALQWQPRHAASQEHAMGNDQGHAGRPWNLEPRAGISTWFTANGKISAGAFVPRSVSDELEVNIPGNQAAAVTAMDIHQQQHHLQQQGSPPFDKTCNVNQHKKVLGSTGSQTAASFQLKDKPKENPSAANGTVAGNDPPGPGPRFMVGYRGEDQQGYWGENQQETKKRKVSHDPCKGPGTFFSALESGRPDFWKIRSTLLLALEFQIGAQKEIKRKKT